MQVGHSTPEVNPLLDCCRVGEVGVVIADEVGVAFPRLLTHDSQALCPQPSSLGSSSMTVRQKAHRTERKCSSESEFRVC